MKTSGAAEFTDPDEYEKATRVMLVASLLTADGTR